MNKFKCVRWMVDLGGVDVSWPQLTNAVAALQLEERSRLERLHFFEDFMTSLVGRLLMRRFVYTYARIEYHRIHFERDLRGKPYWEPPEGNTTKLSFNVSHQGDFVVLAGIVADPTNVENSFGIGIDVMKLELVNPRPLKPFFNLMSRKFAEREWEFIKHYEFDEHKKLKAFMRHWCLKESYVKELGVGITIDLKSLCFNVERWTELEMENSPMTTATLTVAGEPLGNYYFEEHLLAPEYCCAIAFKNCRPEPNKVERVPFKDLFTGLPQVTPEREFSLRDYCGEVMKKEKKVNREV